MRGEALDDFMKTRNAPGALYSVAGRDASSFAWDAETDGESRDDTARDKESERV